MKEINLNCHFTSLFTTTIKWPHSQIGHLGRASYKFCSTTDIYSNQKDDLLQDYEIDNLTHTVFADGDPQFFGKRVDDKFVPVTTFFEVINVNELMLFHAVLSYIYEKDFFLREQTTNAIINRDLQIINFLMNSYDDSQDDIIAINDKLVWHRSNSYGYDEGSTAGLRLRYTSITELSSESRYLLFNDYHIVRIIQELYCDDKEKNVLQFKKWYEKNCHSSSEHSIIPFPDGLFIRGKELNESRVKELLVVYNETTDIKFTYVKNIQKDWRTFDSEAHYEELTEYVRKFNELTFPQIEELGNKCGIDLNYSDELLQLLNFYTSRNSTNSKLRNRKFTVLNSNDVIKFREAINGKCYSLLDYFIEVNNLNIRTKVSTKHQQNLEAPVSKSIEEKIREIIKGSLDIKTENFQQSNNGLSHLNQFEHRGQTMEKINHFRGTTFFTDHYIKTLQQMLGNSKDFLKLSDSKKKLIQMSIDQMTNIDHSLKSYLHKSIYSSTGYHFNFPNEFKNFKKSYCKLLELKDLKTQRSYTHTLFYKFERLHEMVVNELIGEGFLDLQKYRKLSKPELNIIFEDYIKPADTFDIIFSKMLQTARDEFFCKDGQRFDHMSLSVAQHQVRLPLIHQLFTNHVSYGLIAAIKSQTNMLPSDDLIRNIRIYILTNPEKFFNSKLGKSYCDGIASIIDAFIYCGIFNGDPILSRIEAKNEYKTESRLFFPTKISDSYYNFSLPPRIIPVETVTKHNMFDFMKQNDGSRYTVEDSQNLFNSLNIANSKKFRINEKCWHILDQIDTQLSSNHDQLALPIPSLDQLIVKEQEFDLYNFSYSKVNKLMLSRLHREVTKKQLNLNPDLYRLIAGSLLETKIWHLKTLAQKQYKFLANGRKSGITRMSLAKIFFKFPLFYTNKICSTTRVFATEFMLSRHVGCLKQLRREHASEKITVGGLAHMMRAYYCEDPEKLRKFEQYVSNNENFNYLKIQKFFEGNRIEYSTKKAFSHFMVLSSELQSTFITKKTGILLQIDQAGSGLTLLGLIFQNKQLLEQCHVLKCENAVGPYKYGMLHFKDYYDKTIEPKNDKVLAMFTSDKKIHKYSMMCYSYNQTTFGRLEEFKKHFFDIYKKSPNSLEFDCLISISKNYPNFMDEIFPGLNSQIQILNKIIKLVALNNERVCTKTIDGELICWQHFKQKGEVRKKFNLRDMTAKQYFTHSNVTDRNGKFKSDAQKHQTRFLAYLVHSIDANLMRKFMLKMNAEHNYSIEQLFDCILLHPNQVGNLYRVIAESYQSIDFCNFMKANVFGPLRSDLDSSKLAEFDALVSEFYKYCDRSITFEMDNSDFKKMYAFEA
jgi:hypothetical protein